MNPTTEKIAAHRVSIGIQYAAEYFAANVDDRANKLRVLRSARNNLDEAIELVEQSESQPAAAAAQGGIPVGTS